jgi:hypothetical protein
MKKPSNPDLYKGNIQLTEDRVTLRDYFAAKGMQGFISNTKYSAMFSGNNDQPVPEFIAEISYQIADAMLKHREL